MASHGTLRPLPPQGEALICPGGGTKDLAARTGPGRARLARVRVYLGSDHAGFELKSVLANWLASAGHEVTDCGPASYHEHDDYPPYVMRAAAAARIT